MTPLKVFAPVESYRLDPRLEHFKDCQRCKLSPLYNENCKNIAMPVGSLQARMAIIAESAGFAESELGLTLVGPSYPPLIGALVKNYGFDENTDFIRFNVNWCQPPINAKATKSQIRQCRYNLDSVIDMMPNLKLIVTVGETALKAVEGDDAVLALRNGRPGRREWMYVNGFSSKREFFTLPIRHPAWLLRIENDRGRIKAMQAYHSNLKFIRDFYDNLDNIEIFQHPYKYHICKTKEEAFFWANRIATDPEIEILSIDYETSEIVAPGWGVAICIAFAFELVNDEGQTEIHAVVFPLKQCVLADEVRTIKAKKGKKAFEHKWKLAPWFDESFESALIEILKPCLTDAPQPTNRPRPRPFILAWNSKFEGLCTKMNWGFDFTPRLEQVPNLGIKTNIDFVPRDLMLMFRFLNNDLRSLSLKTVLSACMPLLASEKDPVQSSLEFMHGLKIIEETGFMLMAVKPPEDVSSEQIREWGLVYNKWLTACEAVKEQSKLRKSKTTKKTVDALIADSERVSKAKKQPSVIKMGMPPCPLEGEALQIVESNWCPNTESIRSELLFERNAFDVASTLDLYRRAQQMCEDGDMLSIGQSLTDDIFI